MTHVDDLRHRVAQTPPTAADQPLATTRETSDLLDAVDAVRERHKCTNVRREYQLLNLVFARDYWYYCMECRVPWPCATLADLAPVIGLVTSSQEAVALLERSLREEPDRWDGNLVMDNLVLDPDLVWETTHLFWVPLGRDTDVYGLDGARRERFIVVNRDGSGAGWRFTGKPGWWDDRKASPRLARRLARARARASASGRAAA